MLAICALIASKNRRSLYHHVLSLSSSATKGIRDAQTVRGGGREKTVFTLIIQRLL